MKVGTGSFVGQPDAMSEALDSNLKFTESGTGDWWLASGVDDDYYYEADSAQATATQDEEACLQAIVDSPNSETVKFYWKVSSEANYDYLQFYIDGVLKDQISGEVGWQQKSYAVDAGIHTLKWRYVKDGSGYSGDDCGWVDFVQWTGPAPDQNPANWQEIAYKQDVTGRRVEKKVDGYSTRYVYDGDSVIAEYDGNNNLLRKYIYGPGIDKPVSMIEVAQSNATYYYHFDALGSVVALSNASGDTVQTYEYSVYGEVAVEDANHPNPYMFAGVRYDIEIGLYYNRARCYNPYTGRFLQTDPIGYEGGLNLYRYCGNNPIGSTDPTGTSEVSLDIDFEDSCDVWYEWTGDFKICNAHHINVNFDDAATGSIKWSQSGVRGVLQLTSIVNTTVKAQKAIGTGAVGSGVGTLMGIIIDCYTEMMEKAIEIIQDTKSKINRPDTYLKAYIRIKEYRRREGITGAIWDIIDIFDNWDCEWAKGSQSGWVEVTGGTGWEDAVGAYFGEEAALRAIGEAIQLVPPKPLWVE